MSSIATPHPASSRYAGLDALKCLCALMIVFLHCPYSGALNLLTVPPARMGVPVFFMITGYFFELKWPRERIGKQLFKAILMYLAGFVLYAASLRNYCLSIGVTLGEYLSPAHGFTDLSTALRLMLLYNESPLPNAQHLWYLSALVYALLLLWLFRRLAGERGMLLLYLATPVLLLISVVFSNYATLVTGYIFRPYETRNFLFCAIPYMGLGSLIRTRQESLLRLFSRRMLLTLFLAFSLLSCAEEAFLSAVRRTTAMDFYFATPFQAFFGFLFFLSPSQMLLPFLALPARIGRFHSAAIYLLHLISIQYASRLMGKLRLTSLYNAFCPLIVFFFTLFLSMALRLILRAPALLRKKQA